jgi:hypothetical protein
MSIEGVLANIAVARLSTSLCVGRCSRCRFAKTFAERCWVSESFSAPTGLGRQVPPDRGGDVVRLETLGELCGGAIDDPRTQPVLVAQHCRRRRFQISTGGARFQDFGSHLWGDLLYFK